jgi:hypothetical protein
MRIRILSWLFIDRAILARPSFATGWFLAYRPILIA